MSRTLRLLALVGAIACHTETLEPLPLDVTITASPATVARDETVSFVVTAQGGSLAAISVSYADNSFEQFVTHGARTARVTFSHTFSSAGTYQVRATVTDVEAAEKSATVDIHVQ